MGATKMSTPKTGIDPLANPDVYYGNTFMWHLTQIFNLCCDHLDGDILQYKDDTTSAYKRLLYDHDTALAFVAPIGFILTIGVGSIFG
jgi:hypothetical protein